MSSLYRFILSFSLAVACGIGILSALIALPMSALAHPAPLAITQTDQAQDFFKSGVKKIDSGNYKGAIKDFTRAIELKADFAPAYSNRCLAYLQLEDAAHAIEDCTQALTLAPKNTEAYLNRGLARYRQGDYLAAIKDDTQVIHLKPEDFRAYYNRGVARSALGNHLEAIEDYDRALGQSSQLSGPLVAEIYNDRGLARFELEDFKGALSDFSVAIRINANDDRAYYNRGCTCHRKGDYQGAIRDFTQSLQLNPANAEAYLNRGMVYYVLGEEQAAIEDLHKAAKYFSHPSQRVAYQKTLELIEKIQLELASNWEIARFTRETPGHSIPELW